MTERENLINAAISVMNTLTNEERQQIFNRFNINNNSSVAKTFPYTYSHIIREANAIDHFHEYFYLLTKFKKTEHSISKPNPRYENKTWYYDEFAKNELIKEIKEIEAAKRLEKIEQSCKVNLSEITEI